VFVACAMPFGLLGLVGLSKVFWKSANVKAIT